MQLFPQLLGHLLLVFLGVVGDLVQEFVGLRLVNPIFSITAVSRILVFIHVCQITIKTCMKPQTMIQKLGTEQLNRLFGLRDIWMRILNYHGMFVVDFS